MINTKDLVLDNEILKLISNIDEFKGVWKAQNLEVEKLRALKQIATVESVASSTRIEGSQLTDSEVATLLTRLEVQKFSSCDEQEVAGYAEVMDVIFESWEYIPLTENHIKQLHRDLLKYSVKDSRHRGEFKKHENSVTAFNEKGSLVGVIFKTASPFDTPTFMKELVDWFHSQDELHPLLAISIFIVVFLEIHPFEDGNGRLSRILTTLLLLKAGYSYVSYSSLESIVENKKERYYVALRATQKTIRSEKTNWKPWILFFLQALVTQVKHLKKKIKNVEPVDSAVLLSVDGLPEISAKILTLLKEQDRVSISHVVKHTGANRNTIKTHLKKLVDSGRIQKRGQGRGVWYTL